LTSDKPDDDAVGEGWSEAGERSGEKLGVFGIGGWRNERTLNAQL